MRRDPHRQKLTEPAKRPGRRPFWHLLAGSVSGNARASRVIFMKALPAHVLACAPSLALLYRATVLHDLPAKSYDDAWDALDKPCHYSPTAATQDFLRQHWRKLITQANQPTLPRRWMEAFLGALASGGNVNVAARAVGIHRRTAYAARRRDRQFARRWADARLEHEIGPEPLDSAPAKTH